MDFDNKLFINIDNDNKYNSSKLLFSIPVHEKQDIINNQIENIFNYNPNCKIILHINKSFTDFNPTLSNYKNLYINPIKFNYIYGKGLLWIHIHNFLEMVKMEIDFDYFCMISSNEMFIKNGLRNYIILQKNGLQTVQFNKNIKWHLFQNEKFIKNHEFNELLKYLGENSIIYGGQAEGNFFEKDIFQKITNIYLNFFKKEINDFETEEVLIQTIFKSFNIKHGLPFTLQNYSNNIVFNEKIINQIETNQLIIPNLNISNTLFSPHIGLNCDSIYSIKRIDRTMNSLRKFISKNGFILNDSRYEFMLNTNYYSNGSKIYFYTNNYFLFQNKKNSIYNWFLYKNRIWNNDVKDINYYFLSFEIKCNKIIDIEYNNKEVGIEISNENLHYNYFFKKMIVNSWNKIKLGLNNFYELKFKFDNYFENLDIEFKNLNIVKLNNEILLENIDNKKENIIICLYKEIKIGSKTNNFNSFHNILKMIIEPLSYLFNVFILIYTETEYNYEIINLLCEENFSKIFIRNNLNIKDLIIDCKSFILKYNFKYHSIAYLNLDLIFRKSIKELNFYLKNINFLTINRQAFINDIICANYDFMIIPNRFINKFYDVWKNKNRDNYNLIYHELENIKISFLDDYLSNNILYMSQYNSIIENNGFDLNFNYIKELFYKNRHCILCKKNNLEFESEFYFKKNKTSKIGEWCWFGYFIDFYEENNNHEINLNIIFEIKINNNKLQLINGQNYGIKTHVPLNYYNNWINELKNNNNLEYQKIELNIKIQKMNQYILFNFDNFLGMVEFNIKNFKIKFLK